MTSSVLSWIAGLEGSYSSDCAHVYINRATNTLSRSVAMYWRYTYYSKPVAGGPSWNINCRRISTSGTTHNYDDGSGSWKVRVGGHFVDETLDWSPCAGGTGNSYTSLRIYL